MILKKQNGGVLMINFNSDVISCNNQSTINSIIGNFRVDFKK
jgi:hypothetical protein